MKNFSLGFLLLLIYLGSFAQDKQNSKIKDEYVNVVLWRIHYSMQIPLLDYANRYGIYSNIGSSISIKFGKNFMIGAEGDFIFGNNIEQTNIYTNISNDLGQISGWNGLYEPYVVNQRGFAVKGTFGKVFSFGKLNKNSGIMASVGFGVLQHKIRLDIETSNVPHLDKTYQKGYDQLSNGFLSSQFIGFQYLASNKRINFFIGWEFNQGFTKNRRSWDYMTNSPPSDKIRKDFSSGFRLGWIIPIYLMETKKYYTY